MVIILMKVIFYTKTKNEEEVLGVFPWDYDDIFSDQPHEIGNPWAPGTSLWQKGVLQHG